MTTSSALRAGDGSGIDAATELPLWRLKDVFIEATTLDREIRMLNRKIDPKHREELTRIIEICRDRMSQANRPSSSAANHAEGPATPTDHIKPSSIPMISIAAGQRPSLLRPPSIRATAAGDAPTKFRPQR